MKRETVFHLTLDEVEQAIVNYITDYQRRFAEAEMFVSIRNDGTAYARIEHVKKK